MARYGYLIAALLSATLNAPASACLWDRDTLAAETEAKKRRMLEIVRVITGRFERNPPLYYEMRLRRVTAELQANAGNFELFDDAGVASDRLGRSDEAIGWMDKKLSWLKPAGMARPDLTNAWYRYYANAGTFYAHRWIRNGASRDNIADLTRARDLIAAAIRVNPSAHFGREKYQLMAIEWLLAPPADMRLGLPDMFGPESRLLEDPEQAVEGLSGLVVLGNAWESVDIYNALTKALMSDETRSSLAYLAFLRACELIDAGRSSALPNSPKGAALKEALAGTSVALYRHQKSALERTFKELRRESDQYQNARIAYMMPRLQAGAHPDTDPNFWADFREPPAPEFQEPSAWPMKEVVAGLLILGGFVAGAQLLRRKRAYA